MTLEIVDTFKSFDNLEGFLCFRLDTPQRARAMRADLDRIGVLEAADPAYVIDSLRGGKLRASRYPGAEVSAREWAAIKAALDE